MITTISALLLLVLFPFVATSVYLAFLAILAMLPSRRSAVADKYLRRFALLIPAHNEERTLPALLASIRALEYPADLVHVVVIADNCDDETAAIARASGVQVCERRDTARRGKGYALAFGLAQLSGGDHAAVVFVDGDCVVSTNLLHAFNRRLEAGASMLQAHYNMIPAGASSTQAVRSLALSLVHLVRPLGKSRFGGSAGLKGSGMCFRRDVIDRVGWNVFGLAEDIEQHLFLVRQGLRVEFVREAVVLGDAPGTLQSAQGQHRRWEAGRLSAARAEVLPLLSSGVRHRSIAMIDAAIELAIPPLSVVGIVIAAMFPVALILRWWPLLALDVIGVGALSLYVASGFVVARTPVGDIARSLIAAPRFAAWKAQVYVRAIITKPTGWESTHRD